MDSVLSLGMMSGTSIDGSVSTAIIETDGKGYIQRQFASEYCYEDAKGVRAVHHLSKVAELAFREAKGDFNLACQSYPQCLKAYIAHTFSLHEESLIDAKYQELRKSFLQVDKPQAGNSNQHEISLQDIIQRSTNIHIQAARDALLRSGLSSQEISYIGYHGQTLYHDPFINKVTVQVGDAQALADSLGIPVVFDFRQEDVKRGGQGAPLAPIYHRALVLNAGLPSAVILNLGGTANLTVVQANSDEMLGFDTGPANGLIDRYVKERAGLAMDTDSALAMSGKVSEIALEALLQNSIILKDGRNYLDIEPPKSLDIRDYDFRISEFESLNIEDACATLNAFTAECIARALDWVQKKGFSVPENWVLCGGGAFSPHLKEQILLRVSKRLGVDIAILSAESVGWSAQAMEAELFAYLAVRSSKKLPITFPGTTGVEQALTAGKLFLPQSR